jgi:CDP-4-dehydro-6-deoxyglucose reductase
MDLQIKYQGHVAPFSRGDTVLDALERSGVAVSSSCRAGACQSCMMRATEGTVPSRSKSDV